MTRDLVDVSNIADEAERRQFERVKLAAGIAAHIHAEVMRQVASGRDGPPDGWSDGNIAGFAWDLLEAVEAEGTRRAAGAKP